MSQYNRKTKSKQSDLPKVSTRINTRKKSELIYVAFLITLNFIAFFPAFSASFVSWDDSGYLFSNRELIEKINLAKIFETLAVMGNYHPITILSYAIDYSLWGLNPFAFHTVNIIFHTLNVVLLYYIVAKIFKKEIFIAFGITALFAIHPLHVESVVWVSERKDVLYVFFLFLAWITYYKATETNLLKYYYFSGVLFILSCLSKGMAVVFPVILVLTDYFVNNKSLKESLKNKIPFFIIAFLFGIIAIIAQKASKAMIMDFSDYSLFERLLFPFFSYCFYLFKSVLPFDLSVFYPYPEKPLAWYYYIAPLVVITIMVLILKSLKNKTIYIYGILFFTFTILPVIQIKPVGEAIAADRYFYLSSVGLFFIFIYFIDFVAKKYLSVYSFSCFFMLIPILFVFLVLTNLRSSDWKNSETIWLSATKTNPKLDIAWYNLGHSYEEQGNEELAYKLYRKTLEINDKNERALVNTGNYFYKNKMLDSAKLYYEKAIQSNNEFAQGWYSMGNIEFVGKNYTAAQKYYVKAVELDPDNEQYTYQLGVTLLNTGQKNEGIIILKKMADAGNKDARKILSGIGFVE